MILENASKHVKSGGVLVYSTCTIEPEENEAIVRELLTNHPEFHIEPADQFVDPQLVTRDGFVETYPHLHGMDGSFSARLRKS